MQIRTLLAARSALLVLGAGLLSGCGSSSTPAAGNGDEPVDTATQQLAVDGAAELESSGQATHMGNIVFAAVTSPDPAKASGELAGPPSKLWPSGCLTRAKDQTNPNVVHLTFKDCTGPFGLVHLNGEEIVTFDKTGAGTLTASFASQNLTANGHPITHSATAEITFSGTERNVDWKGAWTRVNGKGDTVAHTSALTIKVDTTTHCRVENGTAKTTVAERELDTTIDNLKLCPNDAGDKGCPSGKVTHTAKKSGKTVTVEFDGSAQASVTGPGGKTFEVPLVCTP